MGVNVRRAALDDLDAIVAFGSAVIPPYYTPILGEHAAQAQLSWWSLDRMAPAVEANRVHVAATDRDVVGVCQTGELAGEQVIWKLYLTPEYRGRSLGVELLRQAVASLPQGVRRIDVEHFAGNTRAAKFYEREGFKVIRTDPAPTGESPNSSIVWRRRQLRYRSRMAPSRDPRTLRGASYRREAGGDPGPVYRICLSAQSRK
jgi:ribosomal protein S18 acetylase RimI-like enzyme